MEPYSAKRGGYHGAPWTFKGDALYQLNLVRADEARKHVPAGLKLVECAGWTLGGVYLARYSESPAGVFDELVVLAGLVWNPPTSCAWAQRVYVNAKSARDHGLRAVGLPSRLATFEQSTGTSRSTAAPEDPPKECCRPWWNVGFAPHKSLSAEHPIVIRNVERGSSGLRAPVAQLVLPEANTAWAPRIKLALPSFSGGTPHHPGLLTYTCQLQTRVNFVRPMVHVGENDAEGHPEDVSTVLKGKPVMCMSFRDMVMLVPKPECLDLTDRQQQVALA